MASRSLVIFITSYSENNKAKSNVINALDISSFTILIRIDNTAIRIAANKRRFFKKNINFYAKRKKL